MPDVGLKRSYTSRTTLSPLALDLATCSCRSWFFFLLGVSLVGGPATMESIQSTVALADHALDLRELPRLLLHTHLRYAARPTCVLNAVECALCLETLEGATVAPIVAVFTETAPCGLQATAPPDIVDRACREASATSKSGHVNDPSRSSSSRCGYYRCWATLG